MSNDETIEALVNFFKQVAAKDAALLEKLHADSSFELSNNLLRFTLPQLHAFLRRDSSLFANCDYLRFRKALHSSPINGAIRELGATITIVDNTGKVDRSIYALQWMDKRESS